MNGLPDNPQQQLIDALIQLGCQRDAVMPEDPNGAEGPLVVNPDAQVHLAFNVSGAGIEFTGGVWLMSELQERTIKELRSVSFDQFEDGLREATAELKRLIVSL